MYRNSDAKTSHWQTAKKLFFDFSNQSTIHGVSYIAEKGRSWFERVWWILVICISVLCCGQLIMDAWKISPIIISFTDKPTPIWQIPFPAVTICPKLFAQSKHINISHIMQRVYFGELTADDLTNKE
jgi:acid-sensing ion channel, other